VVVTIVAMTGVTTAVTAAMIGGTTGVTGAMTAATAAPVQDCSASRTGGSSPSSIA
jgi:hypothetical protein